MDKKIVYVKHAHWTKERREDTTNILKTGFGHSQVLVDISCGYWGTGASANDMAQ